MPTTPSTQEYSPEAEDTIRGAVNIFQGITAAIDGTTASQLDVTVLSNAFAVLGDGTLLHPNLPINPLVSVNIPGNTVTGSYTLYLTYTWVNGALNPVFYVALTSVGPSNTYDLAIATFAVSGSVITTASVVASVGVKRGLQFIQQVIVFGTVTYNVGTLPAGAVIDYIVQNVATAFNAGTNNQYEIGFSGTLAGYGQSTTTSLATVGTTFFPAVAGSIGAAAVPVIITTQLTGTAASTGKATVTIVFHQ